MSVRFHLELIAFKFNFSIYMILNKTMSISEEKFQEIKNKYGHMSSWAIWKNKDENGKEKSNVGNIFETVSQSLNPNVVFIGLNISKKIVEPFANFHSTSSRSHDYKIRYGYSILWGILSKILKKKYPTT